MLNSGELHDDRAAVPDEANFRDIHPLTTPPGSWHRSASGSLSDFTSMSREFTAMVAAGAATGAGEGAVDSTALGLALSRIGEEEVETNPLAIVPDTSAVDHPEEVSVSRVRKEEAETKISAWQTAEIAKINSRFKREEVVINGWESEQVENATARLKKTERRLEEERAKAVEKAQNEVAKARRKAEERRASAEAQRGLKIAKVLELASFMKAVGRVPSKPSFF